jgi:hypothetical protein
LTLDSTDSSKAVFAGAFAQREEIKQDEGFCLYEVTEGPNKGRMIVFFYTLLEKADIKKIDLVDFPDSVVASTNAIPGLHIFPNFITE